MKSLILFALFLAPSAHAVDTSGCSPLASQTANASTASGNALRAVLSRAPQANCWNADESSIRLTYTFARTQGMAFPRVSMYTSVNGVARTVDATVQCDQSSGFGYGADTSGGPTALTCKAYAVVPAPAQGSVNAEVAVVVDGAWDTANGQNNAFNF